MLHQHFKLFTRAGTPGAQGRSIAGSKSFGESLMARRAWQQTLAIALGAWLAAGVGGASPPAAAQAQTVLRAPQEVTNCLCKEFDVNTMANDVAARQRIYEDARRAFESLDAEVNQRRQT